MRKMWQALAKPVSSVYKHVAVSRRGSRIMYALLGLAFAWLIVRSVNEHDAAFTVSMEVAVLILIAINVYIRRPGLEARMERMRTQTRDGRIRKDSE